MSDSSRPSNWNVPNAITVIRILAAPAVFWLTLTAIEPGPRWIAMVVFVLVLATDGIDGYIARSRGLVTDLGKILDPIADKLVTNGVLVCLSLREELPWPITAIIVLREVGITVWRLVEVRRGNVVPASSGGKLKTISQSVAIALALSPLALLLGPWVHVINTLTMSVAFLLTVWTGINYLVEAARLRRAQ